MSTCLHQLHCKMRNAKLSWHLLQTVEDMILEWDRDTIGFLIFDLCSCDDDLLLLLIKIRVSLRSLTESTVECWSLLPLCKICLEDVPPGWRWENTFMEKLAIMWESGAVHPLTTDLSKLDCLQTVRGKSRREVGVQFEFTYNREELGGRESILQRIWTKQPNATTEKSHFWWSQLSMIHL